MEPSDSVTSIEKYLPNKDGIKINTNQKVNFLVDEAIQFEWMENSKHYQGQIIRFKEKSLARTFLVQETERLAKTTEFNDISDAYCLHSDIDIQGTVMQVLACIKDEIVVFIMSENGGNIIDPMREIMGKVEQRINTIGKNDEIKEAIDLYNSWPNIKQKEFDSIITSTLKSYQYHEEHPEEKEALLKQARELLNDWKKARETENVYWSSTKTRGTPTYEELMRRKELLDDAQAKWTKFINLAMHSVSQEMKVLFLEAQSILNKK